MPTDIDRGQQAAAEDARRREAGRDYGRDYGRDSDRDYGRNLVGDDYGTGAAQPYEDSNLEGYGRRLEERPGGGPARRRGYGSEGETRRDYAGENAGSSYGYGTDRDPYRRRGYRGRQDVRMQPEDVERERAETSHRGYSEEPIWSDTEPWSLPGPMTGRGPRNYGRADERILEDVCERLTEHGGIDASDVEVKVVGGEVALTGTVEDRRQKWLAEDVAEDVSGVREVRNEIHVRRQEAAGGRAAAGRRGAVVGTFREAPAEESGRATGEAGAPGGTPPGQAS